MVGSALLHGIKDRRMQDARLLLGKLLTPIDSRTRWYQGSLKGYGLVRLQKRPDCCQLSFTDMHTCPCVILYVELLAATEDVREAIVCELLESNEHKQPHLFL